MGKVVSLRPPAGVTEELSDEALMGALSAGDSPALAALYDRYAPDVHRFFVRYRGVDDHLADDLMQETFLALMKTARRFGERSSVRAWVLGIAANVARHHVRADVRAKERAHAFVLGHAKAAVRPDEQAESRELVRRLEAGMAALAHDLRVAFLMCDLENVRGVDAARALGIREGTLYRRLHDARRCLRQIVEGKGP